MCTLTVRCMRTQRRCVGRQLANEYMVPMLQRKVECRLTQHIVLDDALMLLDAAMAFNGSDALSQTLGRTNPC